MCAGRSGALTATDTRSVAWLVGTFGHDAGASHTAYRDYVSGLDDVCTDSRPSDVPPPRARAHVEKILTRACSSSLVRLCYTLKGYGVELTDRQACLAVLVAGQRSQASFGARVAVNVLVSLYRDVSLYRYSDTSRKPIQLSPK